MQQIQNNQPKRAASAFSRQMQPRIPKKNVHGILLLDKPTGISSNAALQQVKRLYRAAKAGHGGTLDPIASGLLIVCLGEATKFSRFLLEANKHYVVTAQLGVKTESGDSEGAVVSTGQVPALDTEKIESVLSQFRGPIQQIPSMFSALKHQGKPLYQLARQGISVERAARTVTIEQLNMTGITDDTLTLEVKASKGTYIRTLVDDIGDALGCGAHVTALRRLGVGPYTADRMISLEALEALTEGEAREKCLQPLYSTVADWPAVVLSEAAAFYLIQGQPVMVPYSPTQGWVRLVTRDNRFLGVGEVMDDGRVAPRRLMTEYMLKQAG
ncbi:MAG: tRNA pseudouridine synthase [Pseudomonadota bacterium]|jgi:tRNA pseudouridine55 synthase